MPGMDELDRCRERIHFRFIQMPCCGQLLCWVNPRIPTYCPECGKCVYTKLKFDGSMILLSDETAWIEHSSSTAALPTTTRDDLVAALELALGTLVDRAPDEQKVIQQGQLALAKARTIDKA